MSKISRMQSQKPQVLAMLRNTDTYPNHRLSRFLGSAIKLEALEEFLFLTEKMLIIFHKNVSHLVAIFTFAELYSVENSHGFNANTVQQHGTLVIFALVV